MDVWLWDEQRRFLILLELCTVYFAFQYAAIFDPAAGFQARRLLVVTDGRMVVVDGGWMGSKKIL